MTVDGRGEPAAAGRFGRRVEALAASLRGTPFIRASGRVAYANFALAEPASSEGAQDTVNEIRDLAPPGARRCSVSGNTAGFIDQKQSLADHLPLLVAIIAATTLIILFLLTGSVLLPLKTLLMNAMTLGATLGIVVLSFQDGLLDGLFDYTGPGRVEVTSLVFLFAIIFGLATDYAVLVMARIKEQHDLGKGNEEAVAIGIGRTGRVITAAARLHRRRLPRLRDQLGLLHEADRGRHGGRRAARRDDRPRPARALADAPARRVELVGAPPAAPLPGALRHLRGLTPARDLRRQSSPPLRQTAAR